MTKRIWITLTALSLSVGMHAQIELGSSVIASGGGYDETEAMSVSWTLGDLAISTLSGGELILTQGFHQPSDFGTGIKKDELSWKISVYPNPVSDIVYVQFDIDKKREFWMEIRDVTGRVLNREQHQGVHAGDVIQLNISNFSSGVYFLEAYTPDRELVQVLKIWKH